MSLQQMLVKKYTETPKKMIWRDIVVPWFNSLQCVRKCHHKIEMPVKVNITDQGAQFDNQFEEAVEKVKVLPTKPTDDELLELYGLFKQATVGDINTEKPMLLDFKAKSKWEAWNKKAGISKEEAQKSYVNYVQTLASKYS